MSIKSALHALFGDSAPLPLPMPDDEAPFRSDPCPDCGCEQMTAGGPVTFCESNGIRARVRQEGAVLTCLGCGARWFSTKSGLRKPHEAALPPSWAMQDLQATMRKAQDAAAAAQRERQEKAAEQKPKPRGPHTGFRTPPRPF